MTYNLENLLVKAVNLESLNEDEYLHLYLNAGLAELMSVAHLIRQKFHPDDVVTYIIDRNINITNVCFSFCEFCNFCRNSSEPDSYITKIEQYTEKIQELYSLGGNQLLLQGGMHPELGLSFYTDLFKELKMRFPEIYLHALSPSEIIFLARKEGLTVELVLRKLLDAGLDSLPGGGAEILSDEVRKKISPLKASATEWLEVMKTAHRMNISTTATMMFGHIETLRQRLQHILSIKKLQAEKPDGSTGFISFIPWTFQANNTRLEKKYQKSFHVTTYEYLRILALSRIMLTNIPNIQASWLTAGKNAGMLGLHGGANDLGSIMLEENVVASTGLHRKMSIDEIETLIIDCGFIPKKRNQRFEYS